MAQRIYLIEDDTALRTELAHVLELSGYAVAAYEGTWGDTAARAAAARAGTARRGGAADPQRRGRIRKAHAAS